MSYTTKKEYVQLIKKFLKPLKKHMGIHGLELGSSSACYSDKTAQAEGFLRVLWGIAPLAAGGEDCDDWIKLYNDHFEKCTDRTLEDYWGDCGIGDQLFVEMTPLLMLFCLQKINFGHL